MFVQCREGGKILHAPRFLSIFSVKFPLSDIARFVGHPASLSQQLNCVRHEECEPRAFSSGSLSFETRKQMPLACETTGECVAKTACKLMAIVTRVRRARNINRRRR